MLDSPLASLQLERTCFFRAVDRQIIFITLIFRACVVVGVLKQQLGHTVYAENMAILCLQSVCTLRTELLNVKDMNELKLMD